MNPTTKMILTNAAAFTLSFAIVKVATLAGTSAYNKIKSMSDTNPAVK